MVTATRIVGGVLVATGVIGYVASGADSVTALIPAFVGIVLLLLGLLAARPNLRRHALHGVVLVAVLAALATIPNTLKLPVLLAGDAERPLAVVSSAVTFVGCVFLTVLGVRSFVAARRARTAAGAGGTEG